jgi:hypothetical protein
MKRLAVRSIGVGKFTDPAWAAFLTATFLFVAAVADPAAAQRETTLTIVVPPTIVAEPASQTALSIVVGPPGKVPANTFVRVRGLPSSVSLTEGHAIAPGSWAIPLIGLPGLKAIVPAGVTGRSEMTVQLIGIDGTTYSETRSALVVGPPTMVAPPPRAAAEPPPKRAAVPPPPPTPAPAVRPDRPSTRGQQLPPEEKERAEKLVAQGQRHLDQGNIGAARLFFQRAAEAGLAFGAIRLAATFDPAELSRLNAQGVRPDRDEARRWYERARELGAPEAEERLARLGSNQ